MRYTDDKLYYAFSASQMRSLDVVRRRLYNDKVVSADDRRDLANALDALMGSAEEFDPADV